MTTIDLAALAAIEDGVPMELRHPQTGAVLLTADGAPITITLLGRDSESYREVERAQQNRRLKDAARGRRNQMTSEQLEAEHVELLVACTVGWSGLVLDAKTLEFSASAARRLYDDGRFGWIREQVETFIGDRGNFFGDSKTS